MIQESLLSFKYYTGVEAENVSSRFMVLWDRVKKIFLSDTAKQWFAERYRRAQNEARKVVRDFEGVPQDEDHWHLWELFAFQKLPCVMGMQAVNAFERQRFAECIIVRAPTWDRGGNKAFSVRGGYDITITREKDAGDVPAEHMKGESPIPYFAIDMLSRQVGKELYIVDRDWRWVFVLAYDGQFYGYQFSQQSPQPAPQPEGEGGA